MLADNLLCSVTGVDIDKGAIDYAINHYSGANIEHVDFDKLLLTRFYQLLSPGGTFICSTSNQDVIPFDKEKFKYHIRHYTVGEISHLITGCGFSIVDTYTQKDPRYGQVEAGDDRCFTILVCRKAK